MPTTETDSSRAAALQAFEKTTTHWGRITMGAGLLFSTAAPLYLLMTLDLGITSGMVWVAFLSVASVFFVFWFIEPITYFPLLGAASMYQAFMIGNIANKLLPSALVAQATIGASPGTRRGEFSALMAICGAAMVHVLSMLVFVGLLGTWLVSIIPADIVDVARLYIFPSIIGGVLIQLIATMQQPRITIIAIVVSVLTLFVLIPLVPALAKLATGIVVLVTATLSWFLRARQGESDITPDSN